MSQLVNVILDNITLINKLPKKLTIKKSTKFKLSPKFFLEMLYAPHYGSNLIYDNNDFCNKIFKITCKIFLASNVSRLFSLFVVFFSFLNNVFINVTCNLTLSYWRWIRPENLKFFQKNRFWIYIKSQNWYKNRNKWKYKNTSTY